MDNLDSVPYETYQALKQEYDQFCYIISHDLSAPLRHIEQFSSLLQRNLSEHMGEDEKVFSGFIKQSIKHNQSMLDGLLTLSRITTEKKQFTHHDIDVVLESVVNEHPDTNIDVNINQLYSVYCDYRLIIRMFSLLIDNAIKFKHEERPLQIRLTGDVIGQEQCLIEIRDNGIGLSSTKKDVIFDPFRKLHSDDKYKGIGMGLTYCRKVVHLHNGTIACTGDENQGALFSVMLPLNQYTSDSIA